jgi:transposase
MAGLRPVIDDEQLAVLRILVDRRRSLGDDGWFPSYTSYYFDRKKAAGKTSNEAMRALKRRLSDVVFRHMVDDAIAHTVTGPGGHRETSTDSSVTGSHSHAGSSEKSLPGPAIAQPRTPLRTAS